MDNKEAKFRFKGYIVKRSLIDISTENGLPSVNGLSIDVKRNNLINEQHHLFKLDMHVGAKDKNNAVNIEIDVEGFFEFDSDLTEEQKNAFFDTNAPAILFPHVRAYINALTSLSGYKPLILPTINFASARK